MRKYNTITILFLLFIYSCSDFISLEERTPGLLTVENSFTEPAHFEAANARLYGILRDDIYQSNQMFTALFNTGTDIGLRNGDGIPDAQFNNYADNLTPTATGDMGVSYLWDTMYEIISNANVVISRIDGENVEFSSETYRNQLKAEALFFRALGYRFLVHMYGGVPLVLEEVQTPKRNFVRATEEEVLEQIISDLNYAADNLPDVGEVEDGRLVKAAAYHLLAEIYITAGEPDAAITAASWVIDNPDYELMTRRFGNRQDDPGDVYWDLFRAGNQNRRGGINTEAIWVCQYEYNVSGGGRSHGNARFVGPQYWIISDRDGIPLFIGPTIHNGGRGISWTGITEFADTLLWERSGWNTDMRNSEHNIMRDLVADNPNSPHFGEMVIENDLVPHEYFDLETWNPTYVKNISLASYPSQYIHNEETGELTASAGGAYTDNYIMRLAETYLLRAEAHLVNNDPQSAADDINVVRDRANADRVNAADVNIDYILDERARELMWEEPRRLTLMRTDKLVDRVREYNRLSSSTVRDHHRLWPIPFSEIENNPDAVLDQNEGYN